MTDNRIEKIIAEIERLMIYFDSEYDDDPTDMKVAKGNVCHEILSFINSLQEEPTIPDIVDEHFDEMLDPNIQYASREAGIKAHAEDYSFNIESVLFQQLSKEQQKLWRKEIEQACISGGYCGLNLANDKRYDQEEPVSEDFCKMADKYYEDVLIGECHMEETIAHQCRLSYYLGLKDGANWQKEQMEKYRIAHCNSITNEQAEMESEFVSSHIDKNNRMPTFLDAIEYGMELQRQQVMKDAVEATVLENYDGKVLSYDEALMDNKNLCHCCVGDKVKVIIIKRRTEDEVPETE